MALQNDVVTGRKHRISYAAIVRVAWGVVILGCIIRLAEDLAHSPTTNIIGDIIALFGFAGAVIFMFLPRIGDYRTSREIDH